MLLGDMTGAAEMLFSILVVDEELAFLAVAVRLVAGHRDDVEDAGGLLENSIHLLQGSVGGLGVEEIDNGEDEGVDDRKDDVGSISNVLESDGGNHDNQKVEYPVRQLAKFS